ncbi:nitrate reductase associated protein [Oscillatoriales cyanobacterium LEGE 11467]|uniref:Nitrate reductase associated protein n=1 Tax=Zarconia navalis LEGE 11467 TaxID=1828826 RepID=A0A928VVX3_9CYAN|nr:nitrate reductase associated protein [Zarconia navalis]MBE9041217.1 nitrate reductase associated protein [Zarconia navalis LEGE 11467]
MTQFFKFEADFVESLRCVPMQVRFKLDTCGIKLKLTQWHRFNQGGRTALVEMPCQTESEIQAYREFLCCLVRERTGVEAKELDVDTRPLWNISDRLPTHLQEKAQTMGVTIAINQWAALTPLQRFALIKLSRPSHENNNFLPALQEFALV